MYFQPNLLLAMQLRSRRRDQKPPVEGALFGVSVRVGRGSATIKEVRDSLTEEFAEVIADGLAEGVTCAGASVGEA